MTKLRCRYVFCSQTRIGVLPSWFTK